MTTLLFNLFTIFSFCFGMLYAVDSSSAVKISSNARLRLRKEVKTFKGKIEIEDNADVQGEKIEFKKGVLEEGNKKQKITGEVDPADGITKTITLKGNEDYKGDGQRMTYKIVAQGANNRLHGEILPVDDIQLQDADASIIYAATRRLDKNIRLNGGVITLEEDLKFLGSNRIIGPGTVNLCQHRLSLGLNRTSFNESIYFDCSNAIQLNSDTVLSNAWTFSGPENVIVGNGNKLSLVEGGVIIIERGSSLKLRNLRVDGLGGSNVFCCDNSATLTLDDVIWIQDSDFTFSQGALQIDRLFDLDGGCKFIYQSPQTSIITKNSTFILENNVTFSYDPIFANNQKLISFHDQSSVIYLNGGTLHTTVTGLHLLKGTMLVEKFSTISAEFLINEETFETISGGIIFGDNNADDDFSCKIINGAILNLAEGDLIYRNVLPTSWNMTNVGSILRMQPFTRLILEQTINTGEGRVQLATSSVVQRNNNHRLIGSREVVVN